MQPKLYVMRIKNLAPSQAEMKAFLRSLRGCGACSSDNRGRMSVKLYKLPVKELAAVVFITLAAASQGRAIMAGSETGLPADSPLGRLDPPGPTSIFNAVGALEIHSGGFSYKGSATAISSHWVLTAGHNLDLNDDGLADAALSINFNLPGFGTYSASAFYTCPGFTGFGAPSVQRDLGLLYFTDTLPAGLLFPGFSGLQLGDKVALVGFGRSGYGNYGYTTDASFTNRRIGYNVVDSFTKDDQGLGFSSVFRYDFDSPDTTGLPGGSLGNNLESLIGAGDSGGPLLVQIGNSYAIAGVSTFTEGYGGRFGDIGGGIVIAPYLDWISATTGLQVPEPSAALLIPIGLFLLLVYQTRQTNWG